MANDRPNVVLFITHDTGQHVSPYGIDTVQTPNAERLSAEGVRFAQSFCTSPLCSPSRAACVTGRYPHQNGVMGLTGDQTGGFDFFRGEKHAAALFGAGGYESVLCGFEHETPHVGEVGFSKLIAGQGNWYNSGGDLRDYGRELTDWFGQRDKGQPFYLQIGCHETHHNWASFDTPPDESRGLWMPPYLKDLPELRQEMAQFQGAVKRLDEGLGSILEAFDRAGATENTIFVFTTDHGIDIPRAKGTMFDPGIGVFLFMRWAAGGWGAGRVVDEMVSNIDVLPTLLEACGLSVPINVAGRSFLPLLENRPYEPRTHVFAQKNYHDTYEPVRTVRTERYKLIRRFEVALMEDIRLATFTRGQYMHSVKRSHDEELYDLQADPWEQNSLAQDPAHQPIVAELRRAMVREMRRTNDPLLHGPISSPYYRHRLEDLLGME